MLSSGPLCGVWGVRGAEEAERGVHKAIRKGNWGAEKKGGWGELWVQCEVFVLFGGYFEGNFWGAGG